MLLILLGLAIAGWFIDPAMRYFHGNPLHLETAVPSQAPLGRTFFISMRITNEMNITSTRFYIVIGEQFMANVIAGTPSPEPRSRAHYNIGRYRNRLVLEYDSLPGLSSVNIKLPFTPAKKGTLAFNARIYAPMNQLVQEVRSMSIQVKDAGLTIKRNSSGSIRLRSRQEHGCQWFRDARNTRASLPAITLAKIV